MDCHVLPGLDKHVPPVDSTVDVSHLHMLDPKPERGVLNPATVIIRRTMVVTGNVADFEVTGVEVLDPWSGR